MRVKTDFAPYVVVGPVEVERVAGRRADRGALALAPRVPHARVPPGRDAAARRLRRRRRSPSRSTGQTEIATATWPVVIVRSRLGPEDRARPEQRASIYPRRRADAAGSSRRRSSGCSGSRRRGSSSSRRWRCSCRSSAGFPGRGAASSGSAPRSGRSSSRVARRAATIPGRRRTALERLGRELGRRGSPELADEATRLAWAESPPASEAMTGLVGRAEQELGGHAVEPAAIPLADTADLARLARRTTIVRARAAGGDRRGVAAACVFESRPARGRRGDAARPRLERRRRARPLVQHRLGAAARDSRRAPPSRERRRPLGPRPLLRRRLRGASARRDLGGAAAVPALLPPPAAAAAAVAGANGRFTRRRRSPARDAVVAVVPVGHADLGRRSRAPAGWCSRSRRAGHDVAARQRPQRLAVRHRLARAGAAPLQARRDPAPHRGAPPDGREPRLLRQQASARARSSSGRRSPTGSAAAAGRPLAGVDAVGADRPDLAPRRWRSPRTSSSAAGSSGGRHEGARARCRWRWRCCSSRSLLAGARAPGRRVARRRCAATTSASSPRPSTRGCGLRRPARVRASPETCSGSSDDVRFRKAERLYVRGHLPATTFAQEKARLAARGGAVGAARADDDRRYAAVAPGPGGEPARHPARRGCARRGESSPRR